jgi:hypothetical protein
MNFTMRRRREWMGLIRRLDVYLDNVRIGDLKPGETRSFEATAGAHRVHVQMDWCRSPDVAIEVSASGSMMLETGSRIGGWLNIFDLPGILLWPRRFLIIESVPWAHQDAI